MVPGLLRRFQGQFGPPRWNGRVGPLASAQQGPRRPSGRMENGTVSALQSFGGAGTRKPSGQMENDTPHLGSTGALRRERTAYRRAPAKTPPALRRQESGSRPDSLASAEQPEFSSERNPRNAKRSPIFGRVMPGGTVDSEGLALHGPPDRRELVVSLRPFGGADTRRAPAAPALLGGTATSAALVPCRHHPTPLRKGGAEAIPGPTDPRLFGGAGKADHGTDRPTPLRRSGESGLDGVWRHRSRLAHQRSSSESHRRTGRPHRRSSEQRRHQRNGPGRTEMETLSGVARTMQQADGSSEPEAHRRLFGVGWVNGTTLSDLRGTIKPKGASSDLIAETRRGQQRTHW
jgi:hypothetical protein